MFQTFAGIDEAGRGPLAGPVVAACVQLPIRWKYTKYLKDSKKLSEKSRIELFEHIIQDCPFGIGYMCNKHIDGYGIRPATHLAMIRAFYGLLNKSPQSPEKLFIDGRDKFLFPIPKEDIIKGDDKIPCIMAASIVAKVYRDCLMKNYSKLHPKYGFENHKGYGTKYHIDQIHSLSHCEIHRKTYQINQVE